MSMAQRIKTLRVSRGLSMSELARRAKISKSVISRIEAGFHEEGLKIETLRAICTALNVPQDELLTVVTLPSSIIEASREADEATSPDHYLQSLLDLHTAVKNVIDHTTQRAPNRDA